MICHLFRATADRLNYHVSIQAIHILVTKEFQLKIDNYQDSKFSELISNPKYTYQLLFM